MSQHHSSSSSAASSAPGSRHPLVDRTISPQQQRIPNHRRDPTSLDSNSQTTRADPARAAPDHPRHAVKHDPSSSNPAMLQNASPPPAAVSGVTAASRSTPDGRVVMPRNPSIDSTVSSTSSLSAAVQRPNGTSAYRVSQDPSAPQDIAALISAAGSAEAAMQKLIAEKNQAASHNAQLWRLVEKQRAMILGLNKDLEKSLKEKERYRKKLKEQFSISEVGPEAESTPLKEQATRGESQSPMIASSKASTPPSVMNIRDALIDDRRASDSSNHRLSDAASSLSRETTDRPSPMPSSSSTRTTGDNRATPRGPNFADASIDARRALPTAVAPINTIAAQESLHQTSQSLGSSKGNALGSTMSPPSSALGFSSPKSATRKAPPAPLQLSSPKSENARVTNNIADASDSEYEDDPNSARADQMTRGRRKTREDDDREREVLARQELEMRSRSAKDKQSKSKSKQRDDASQPAEAKPAEVRANEAKLLQRSNEQPTKPVPYQHMDDPANILRQRARSDAASGMLPKSATAPSLLSPGLPMSPRPGDRPMNSPMPRAPINAMPMSPMAGAKNFPLSPRAPRQPIPLPPQTPLSFTSPHLARAEAYQVSQPAAVVGQLKSPSNLSLEQDKERSSTSSDPSQLTPGDIYRGFMTEQYPSLLLPPNALPHVYVKTASSRMKPSRQSYIAPRPGDENPVFTLAVYDRAENKQLWRTEKTYAALASLDQQVKTVCAFRERIPDRALFTGHAPAKIDARRIALDIYVGRMMEAIFDEKSALVVCKFLSADAFGPVESDAYFPSTTSTSSTITTTANSNAPTADSRADTPTTKQRAYLEGYLTKRGKNFGGWKARYFVLDGPSLKYFDDRGGALQGAIKLQNAQIGKQTGKEQNVQEDEDNQFRHAFLIMEPKKKDSANLVKHVLCAENDEERDAWVEALLQYVDFKDEDTESLARGGGVQITKTTADISNASGARSPRLQRSFNDLRPSSAKGRDQAPSPAASDHLRAVGYDDTVAGDAPIMGNSPTPRKGDTPSPTDVSSLSHSTQYPPISGPTNMQAIPNDWGMKPPPTPHGKDNGSSNGGGGKKRGIFSGFRGRSSSDLNTNDKAATASPNLTPQQDQRPTGSSAAAVRAVFGIPLAEAVEVSRPLDAVTELPAVVYRCIEFLKANNAALEEGIFRLSGSTNVIRGLRERFNTEGDVNLVVDAEDLDVHAVAGLLKGYLRELPSSILTRELHLDFLGCLEMPPHAKIVALNRLVNRLPTANYALLQSLAAFLSMIVNNSEVNRMNIRNVGIVFAPTLNVPAPLITAFVEEQSTIFGPPIPGPSSKSASSSSDNSKPNNNNNSNINSTAASNASAGHYEPTPTDLRSPRKQMFSDLPTPAYNQTSFPTSSIDAIAASSSSIGNAPLHSRATPENDTGMIPLRPNYAPIGPHTSSTSSSHAAASAGASSAQYARLAAAQHAEAGFGSLNEALRSPVPAPAPSQPQPQLYQPSGGAVNAAPTVGAGNASGGGGVVSHEVKAKRRESGFGGLNGLVSPSLNGAANSGAALPGDGSMRGAF